MKRLFFPALLVLGSLVCAIAVTTITAVTLASYSKEPKTNSMVQQSGADRLTVKR